MPPWIRDSAYVDLPPECSKPGTCGLLQYWLYGMRPASHGWEAEYTRQLEAIGFVAGAAFPSCFYRASDDVACVVHGDDFTFEGESSSLQEIAKALVKVWLVKIRGTYWDQTQKTTRRFLSQIALSVEGRIISGMRPIPGMWGS